MIENLEVVREDMGREILKEMNIYRASKGINQLGWSEEVYQIALDHTIYQAQR